MTDYEQGRSDERASLLGEIEKYVEGLHFSKTANFMDLNNEEYVKKSDLLSFLSSLKEKDIHT